MSDLSKMGIDPKVTENEGAFKVVPAGKYKAVMIGDQIKDTKAKDGKIFVIKNQIIEGEHSGCLISDNLNIQNKSKVAQEIGQGTLKRICRLTGVVFPPPDTSYMYGKPYMITVAVKEFESNTTGNKLKSNDILAYNEFILIEEKQVVNDKTSTSPAPGESNIDNSDFNEKDFW